MMRRFIFLLLIPLFLFSGIDGWYYSGDAYFLGDEDNSPHGMEWDGTNYYMVGHTSEDCYKYDASWTYVSTHVLRGANPTAVVSVGTDFYVVTATEDSVYKYDASWAYQDAWYVGAQCAAGQAMDWDGTNWWIACKTRDSVFKYNATFVYSTIAYDLIGQEGNVTGIEWDGTNWWMCGNASDSVYKYDASWNYTGASHFLGDVDILPNEIAWDGTNWWMVGQSSGAPTDSVYKYKTLGKVIIMQME